MAVTNADQYQREVRIVVGALRPVAEQSAKRVIELAEQLAVCAAPTGAEANRAELVRAFLAAAGIADVTVDGMHNVVVRIPGKNRNACLLLAGHTDTVFPLDTPLTVSRRPGIVAIPGIGDNCLGTAAVLMIPHILREAGIEPAVDLLLTGNVGEEGLGNLRGMRAVVDANPDIQAAVAVEGHGLGRVTHIAVGSRRLRVTVTGPGGHSWGDFGRPNAIQVAADLIHDLNRIPLSQQPKTTLSVGTISGGISVNTIAPTTTFVIDMRSVSGSALSRLGERVKRVLGESQPGVTVDVEVLGDRPAGDVPQDSPIVQIAIATLAELGMQPQGDASSTDANIPISRGIPAICVGITTGGNVHRVDEYIDTDPVPDGLTHLAAVTKLVGDGVASGVISTGLPT